MNILNFVLLLSLCSCASFKEKTLASMGGSFLLGSAIGVAQAPKDENSKMHGLLWGAGLSALTGAALIYLYDESSELKNKNFKIESLERDLSAMKLGEKSQIDMGKADFYEKALPKKLKSIVDPGEWKLYQVDEWKELSHGVLIHQDQMIEYKEPKFKVKKE